MNDKITWILIANAFEAKLYSTKNLKENWVLLKELVHPQSRQHDSDLVSDKSGSYRASMRNRSDSFSERTDPKEGTIDQFARSLAEELNAGHAQHEYHQVIIVAPARFYGHLKSHCDKHILELITHHLEKDYIGLKYEEILVLVRQQVYS